MSACLVLCHSVHMVAQWWAALLLISLPTNRIHRPVVAPVTLTLTRWHIYQLTWIFWRCTCIPNIIVSAHSSQNLEPKHDTPMHFFAVVILTRWPWYINLTYDDDDDVCVCVCVWLIEGQEPAAVDTRAAVHEGHDRLDESWSCRWTELAHTGNCTQP